VGEGGRGREYMRNVLEQECGCTIVHYYELIVSSRVKLCSSLFHKVSNFNS